MNPGVQAMLVAIVGGVLAQWIGRLIRLPAILPLLLLGVALGPQGPLPLMPLPETAMPGGLRALIALGVVVILFEGGLSLNLNDLRLAPKAVRNLITVGAVISFVGAAAAAYYLLQMELREALFFGSLMTVTGPTVIGPLLKNIKVKPRVHTVLLWESILIDAVGAMLAVVILQIYFEDFSVLGTGYQFVGGLLVGPVIGLVIGWLVAKWLAWRQATGRADEEFDHLLALAGALGIYGLSEKVSHDSGLGAVIVAGLVTAHILKSQARKLREFKGTLTTLLVSTLFMLLAANFDLKDLKRVWPEGLYVLGVVMLIVRPANILLSTRGSKLSWREKVFLCWIAPRGIVAASVASIVGRTLAEHGAEDAGRQLVAMTFLVIAGTVVLNGLTARPLAWLLNLRAGETQGTLIVGAHPLGLQLATFLDHEGLPAILVDTNPKHCAAAKLLGFHTIECSALDHVQLAIQDLTGIGQLIALTPNAGVNARACIWRTAGNYSDQAAPDPSWDRMMKVRKSIWFHNVDAMFDLYGNQTLTILASKDRGPQYSNEKNNAYPAMMTVPPSFKDDDASIPFTINHPDFTNLDSLFYPTGTPHTLSTGYIDDHWGFSPMVGIAPAVFLDNTLFGPMAGGEMGYSDLFQIYPNSGGEDQASGTIPYMQDTRVPVFPINQNPPEYLQLGMDFIASAQKWRMKRDMQPGLARTIDSNVHTGYHWANVAKVSPDVVATGNVVTLRVGAGFIRADKVGKDGKVAKADEGNQKDFLDADGNYILPHGETGDYIQIGGGLLVQASDKPDDVNASDRITILRGADGKLLQRLVPDPNEPSLLQWIELTVEIGKDVSPAVYDVNLNLGAVEGYLMTGALDVISLDFIVQNQDNLNEPITSIDLNQSEPTPVIILPELDINSVSIDGEYATISISGSVRDPLADNSIALPVISGGADIDLITAWVDGVSTGVSSTVSRTGDGPPTYWRQHPYLGQITPLTVRFKIPTSLCSYIFARTSPNGVGNYGESGYCVEFYRDTMNNTIIPKGIYLIPQTIVGGFYPFTFREKSINDGTEDVSLSIQGVSKKTSIKDDGYHYPLGPSKEIFVIVRRNGKYYLVSYDKEGHKNILLINSNAGENISSLTVRYKAIFKNAIILPVNITQTAELFVPKIDRRLYQFSNDLGLFYQDVLTLKRRLDGYSHVLVFRGWAKSNLPYPRTLESDLKYLEDAKDASPSSPDRNRYINFLKFIKSFSLRGIPGENIYNAVLDSIADVNELEELLWLIVYGDELKTACSWANVPADAVIAGMMEEMEVESLVATVAEDGVFNNKAFEYVFQTRVTGTGMANLHYILPQEGKTGIPIGSVLSRPNCPNASLATDWGRSMNDRSFYQDNVQQNDSNSILVYAAMWRAIAEELHAQAPDRYQSPTANFGEWTSPTINLGSTGNQKMRSLANVIMMAIEQAYVGRPDVPSLKPKVDLKSGVEVGGENPLPNNAVTWPTILQNLNVGGKNSYGAAFDYTTINYDNKLETVRFYLQLIDSMRE